MPSFWILFPTVAAIAVLVFLWLRRRERERTDALRHFARTRGFEFRERIEDPGFGAPLFRRGHGRRWRNVLVREGVEAEITVCDFRYVERHGRNSSVEQQTVVAFRSPGRALPRLELRPEHVLHKLGALLGARDIDFENRPGFSGKYLLRGPDEGAIRDVFRTEVLAFFEKNPGWSVETDDDRVFVYRARRRAKPEDLAAYLDEAGKVYATLRGGGRDRFG